MGKLMQVLRGISMKQQHKFDICPDKAQTNSSENKIQQAKHTL